MSVTTPSIYTNTFNGMPVQPANLSFEVLTLTSGVTQLQWPIPYQETTLPVANFISVNCGNNTYAIQMPDATLVSVGQATIFYNLGDVSGTPSTFSVIDFEGGEILANLALGSAVYVILTDNTTQDGSWQVVALGGGSSGGDAAALAGYGLIALLGKLNTQFQTTSINTSYTINPVTDRATTFLWTGGTANLTLPVSGSGSGQAPNGFFFGVNNTTSGGGLLTVIPSGGQTVDNLTTFSINPGESSFFISNGAGWSSIGYGTNVFSSIGVNTISTTGGTYTMQPQECARQIQNVTGSLSSALTIIATTLAQQYIVTNNTTNNFTVNFQMQGKPSTQNLIPQGTTMQFYCDSVDMHSVPTNTIGVAHFSNGTNSAPSISFLANPMSGIYSDGPGDVLIGIQGVLQTGFKQNYIDAASNVLPRVGTISIFDLNQCYD